MDDPSIKSLKEECQKMCSFVEENIRRAFAYYASDVSPKDFKPIDDDTVDGFERRLEGDCLDILVKEHLYAGNMRQAAGILKVVEDIERIGDHAEDVAEWSGKLKNVNGEAFISIQTMCRIALEMVHDAFLAFSREDVEMAEAVEKEDDIQDSLYDACIEELISDDRKDGANHAGIIYSAILAKYLERISDHAVNVAEWVVFIVKGYHKDKQIF